MSLIFRTKMLHGKSGYFADSVGIGTSAPSGGLHISGGDIRVEGGDTYFENRPFVSGVPIMVQGDLFDVDTTSFYPKSNPSGFISGISQFNYTGGDLTGSLLYPIISKINGNTISADSPASGQALQWNGSAWVAGGIGVTVSDTAPASSGVGGLWLNSNTLSLFVYYGSSWVEVTTASFANRSSRSEWVEPYQYLAFAAVGAQESSNTWIIYRNQISSAGAIITKLSATGSWSNRATLNYV